jgi:sugar phosphate permease
MSRGDFAHSITRMPQPPSALLRPSHVRYQVLAVACSLALLTYIHRLGFVAAASRIKIGLGLSDEYMGYLMSAFLVAYALFQMPGGLLGDSFGARHLLTFLVLGWSLLTGAVALVVYLPAGTLLPFAVLLVLRFLFGMFQAGGFPALARVVADWMPVRERGSAQGTIWTLSRLGGALSPLLFGWLFRVFGTWTTPFWILAGLGVVWSAAFWPWFRNRPEEMRSVNAAERELIAAGRPVNPAGPGPVPWLRMLGSLNVWLLCLMYGFVGFTGNFITNMLPLYLRGHLDLSDEVTDGIFAVTLGCGIISCVLGGVFSDWLIRRFGSRKWGRRLVGFVALACAGLAVLGALGARQVWLVGLFFSAWFFFNDLNMGPAWAACADIGERYAGTLSGAMNMLGSLCGAAGAAFAGRFFDKKEDTLVFVVFACSYALAALCWLGINVTKPLIAKDQALTL